MTVAARYKGLIWQLLIKHELATQVEEYLKRRRSQETYRTVSRNEVLCELIERGLKSTADGSDDR